jgi:2-aminoethylphosphonate--pyruvate transaminase
MSSFPPRRAQSETGDPLLLTPGPLTTSRTVKQAMVHDWGSRDAAFLKINKDVLTRLPEIIHGAGEYVTVPMQGSGTFAVEAMLTSLVPADGKVLVLINGAYGHRAKRILDIAHRATVIYETPEDTPPDPDRLNELLKADPAITHVFAVHCETTSGIRNPIEAVADVVARNGRRLLIDAMSAFGALALDSRKTTFDAVAASSNKCIEGVPGLGFVLVKRDVIAGAKGNATSLVLDLHDQWQGFEKTGQFRFTPPIHVIVAFHQALEEFWAEGGVAGRGGRYAENCRILIEGMQDLGFSTLLPASLQTPIIVTFHMPKDPAFDFQHFYDGLSDRGFLIYPGKLTVADSFRIGCIGRLYPKDMHAALAAVREVLADLGVSTPLRSAA